MEWLVIPKNLLRWVFQYPVATDKKTLDLHEKLGATIHYDGCQRIAEEGIRFKERCPSGLRNRS